MQAGSPSQRSTSQTMVWTAGDNLTHAISKEQLAESDNVWTVGIQLLAAGVVLRPIRRETPLDGVP